MSHFKAVRLSVCPRTIGQADVFVCPLYGIWHIGEGKALAVWVPQPDARRPLKRGPSILFGCQEYTKRIMAITYSGQGSETTTALNIVVRFVTEQRDTLVQHCVIFFAESNSVPRDRNQL